MSDRVSLPLIYSNMCRFIKYNIQQAKCMCVCNHEKHKITYGGTSGFGVLIRVPALHPLFRLIYSGASFSLQRMAHLGGHKVWLWIDKLLKTHNVVDPIVMELSIGFVNHTFYMQTIKTLRPGHMCVRELAKYCFSNGDAKPSPWTMTAC